MNSLELMAKRLNYYGGKRDVDRIDWQKNNDLEKALRFSDKSEFIQREDDKFSILIDSSRTSEDYNEMEIQGLRKCKLKIGDILFWFKTKTYWMITSQELQETAIFKGLMRQCNSLPIEVDGEMFFGIIIGPNEVLLKHNNVETWGYDISQETIQVTLPANEKTKKIQRYSKFKIGNKYWEVNFINDYTNPNFLNIYLKEDYKNNQEENIPTIEVKGRKILGDKEISPYREYTYKLCGEVEGEWAVNDNVSVLILNKNETEITLQWNNSKKGSFILSYGNIEQEIKARSLF